MQMPKGCENQIGARVRQLDHAMNRVFREQIRGNGDDGITAISGRIMGMIYWSGDRDVFQKDVEEAFHITRSSVTSAVQLMEKKGYITRRSVPCDARLKKLALTDRGIAAHKQAVQAMELAERIADSALTGEERQTFLALCDKLSAAMEAQSAGGGEG